MGHRNPHALPDSLERHPQSTFQFGVLKDPFDLLHLLCRATGLGAACFRAVPSSGGVLSRGADDVVEPYDDDIDADGELGRLLSADVIDVMDVLKNGFQHMAPGLRASPSLLAVMLPQYIITKTNPVDDDLEYQKRRWVEGGNSPVRSFVIQNDLLDLRGYLSTGSVCHDAVYRIRAFVHYPKKGKMPCSVVSQKAHFTAYFREGAEWYLADDYNPAARVTAMTTPPSSWPYICYLERVGAACTALPVWPPNVGRAADVVTDAPADGAQELADSAAASGQSSDEFVDSGSVCSTTIERIATDRRGKRGRKDTRVGRGHRDIVAGQWFQLGYNGGNGEHASAECYAQASVATFYQ